MSALHHFLQNWNRPFVRGVSDCCGFVAAWIEYSTGRTVVCPHLGTPLTDGEATQILRVPGGLRGMAVHYLTEAGCLERKGEPLDGDIVIADRVQGFHRTLLGIWSAGYLVSVSREGMCVVPHKSILKFQAYGH